MNPDHKALYVAIAASQEAAKVYTPDELPDGSIVVIQILKSNGITIESSSCQVGRG